MTSLILILSLSGALFAQNPLAPTPSASACLVCEKMDKIQAEADENEVTAARTLADYLETAEFSKSAEIRKKEFTKVLPLAARLVEKDDQFDIAQILVSIKDTDKKLFDETVKQQPEKARKRLNHWEQKMRKQMDKGEEP
ncbi:MAG: hypothetical protein ACK5P7_05060 [Bdellovibrio sp.]|jgi:hypothetical protein